MKRISILMVLILSLTLGCVPKNSIEMGQPNVSNSEPSTELQTPEEPRNVSIPSLEGAMVETPAQSLEDISGQESLAESSLPHLYEDVTPPPQKLEAPSTPARVGVGLAWFVGGFLVFHVGAKVEATLFRLNAVYTKLIPTITRSEQLKIGEAFVASTARLAQKFGLRQHVAEKLSARIIVTKSATWLAMKKGLTHFFGPMVGLVKWAAPFMWGIGLMQMVLDPTEVGGEGDEPGPEDRFNFLKKAIEALEKKPHDVYLQDSVIQATLDYLYDFINLLKYEYNEAFYAFEELKARQDISSQDKELAQKEFEEFWTEQERLVEYFKTVSESLKEIYYIEGSDRSKAEALLRETMKKLEVILERQKEKKENTSVLPHASEDSTLSILKKEIRLNSSLTLYIHIL